jgi:hypothetical protein
MLPGAQVTRRYVLARTRSRQRVLTRPRAATRIRITHILATAAALPGRARIGYLWG